MGRAPCCDKSKVKRGTWSPEEDMKLKDYIHKFGTGGNWIALPQKVGLKRCGKSCRLRWLNYLRPNIKHGDFSEDEDTVITTLFATIGSRWSIIAAQLPGRTDNDIKNYWNTKLKKKLLGIPAYQRKSNLGMTQMQNYQTRFEDQNTGNLLMSGYNDRLFDQNDNCVISYPGLPEDSQYYDLFGSSSSVNDEASMRMYASYGESEYPSSMNISFRTQETDMYSYILDP